MKVYGQKRYDALACRQGCCTTKYGKEKDSRKIMDRSRRKTARQTGKLKIFTQLLQSEFV